MSTPAPTIYPNKIIYYFNGVLQPFNRLARVWMETKEVMVGIQEYPIKIISYETKLYKAILPDSYKKDTRYIKILPDLLQTYPNSITSVANDNIIMYNIDTRSLPPIDGQVYVLEFFVHNGRAHYSGRVVVTTEVF